MLRMPPTVPTSQFWGSALFPLCAYTDTTKRWAHTLPAAEAKKNGVLPYDFHRRTSVNGLKWPIANPDLDSMSFRRFTPCPTDKSDTEWMKDRLREKALTWTNVAADFHENQNTIFHGESIADRTTHQDNMYLGLADTPKGLHRYLVKNFSRAHYHLAMREVAGTYIGVELGEKGHFLKTTYTIHDDKVVVLRRYARGHDAKIWLKDPKQFDAISDDELVKLYALIYVLLGDTDWANPGNVISPENSKISDKLAVPIDMERILPNPFVMEHVKTLRAGYSGGSAQFGHAPCMARLNRMGISVSSAGSEKFYSVLTGKDWKPGDSYTGSPTWRRALGDIIGPHNFFRFQMESVNPFLALIHSRGRSLDTVARFQLSDSFARRAIAAQPHLESLMHFFQIYTEKELLSGNLDFQQVLQAWKGALDANKPVTLEDMLTGNYR